MSHSPTPWRMEVAGGSWIGPKVYQIRDANDVLVADLTMADPPLDDETALANAALIMKAPTMFLAIMTLYERFTDGRNSMSHSQLESNADLLREVMIQVSTASSESP